VASHGWLCNLSAPFKAFLRLHQLRSVSFHYDVSIIAPFPLTVASDYKYNFLPLSFSQKFRIFNSNLLLPRTTMSSSNPNPRRVPIVDNLSLAPIRSRRGGRLRSLGSSSSRIPSLPSSSSTPPSRTRGSLSQRSSSRGKEPSEPLREPLVEEIVPAELSFYNDRESLRNQLSSLDRVDTYPTQITEGLISIVRRDFHWGHDFPIIIPNANQRITSYLTGFSFCLHLPFHIGF